MSLLALYSCSVNKARLVELQSPVVCSAVGLEGTGEMWDKSAALLQFSSTLYQGTQRIFLVLLGCLLWCSPVLPPSARAMEGDDQPPCMQVLPFPPLDKIFSCNAGPLLSCEEGAALLGTEGHNHVLGTSFFIQTLHGLETRLHYPLFHC